MIYDWALPALAAALAALALPLFFDLALCLAGNLLPARVSGNPRRAIQLAVVIPAHNEEALIARAVQSVLAAEGSIQVFVVAHNCTDATAARAAEARASVVVLNDPASSGKPAALRCGFEAARHVGANAFLVVDADSVVSPNFITAMRAALDSGAEAAQCRYELDLATAGTVGPLTRLRALAFRGMNVLRARGRAGFGLSAGIFGNGFALTTALMQRVPFAVESIAEDLEYHARVVSAGYAVAWVDTARVLAPLSSPGAAQAAQEARWEGGRMHVARRTTATLLAAIRRGRLAALETLCEVWSLPLSRGILALALAAALPVHWVRIYALACALLTLLYGVAAAFTGDQPGRDLAALALAPIHLLWKALLTPMALRHSGRQAAWERTRREEPRP